MAVAAYLLTGLSYIDPECAEPVVYSCYLPLVEACGPAVASWMRAAHQCPLDIHITRVGMNSSEFHESIGMVLTDATSGHSRTSTGQRDTTSTRMAWRAASAITPRIRTPPSRGHR